MARDPTAPGSTRDPAYCHRLERLEGARWKRWLDVQAPYRWNLRRLRPGRTLDVGCGIGRHLVHLPPGSVGVDTNPLCVARARERGAQAYAPGEFRRSPAAAAPFDSLLFAHVLEHGTREEAEALVRSYLPHLRPGGRLIFVTPQEAGQRSDPTHRTFLDFAALRAIAESVGARVEHQRSFPLPRAFGRVFPHNEFVVVARLPGTGSRGSRA